jgi:hypothetical protein
MKIHIKILLTLFILFSCSIMIPSTASAQRGNVSLQIFYDQLSPYGQWSSTPDYGYIWIPDVGPEFSPYSTNGSWVMTDYGWTWVSDYPWGWAPFHYGRWDFDNDFGWFWVPDYEWGPSWVTWRRGDGYYGWAPMRPGISVSMSFGNSYADVNRWNFVRDRDFGRSNISRYYVNRRDNDVIIRRSSVINNTYNDNNRSVTYIAGPRREDVQRYTGRRFDNITVRDNDRPGQRLTNNQLEIYRPQIDRNNDARERSAPAQLSDVRDIGPAGRRTSNFKQNNVPVQQSRQQQSQPAETKRQDQIQVQQRQQQQQIESKRQDQVQVQQKQQQQQQVESKQQDQVQVQQKQQQQQQQTESKRQDQVQTQPRQNVQQNVQGKQQTTSTMKSRRLERQQNRANNPDKKGRNKDTNTETSGKH